MHTSRNRLARKTRRDIRRGRLEAKPPVTPAARDSGAFMLRDGGAPAPGFPADLIVPPHRGAVITEAAWPNGAPAAPGLGRKAAKKAERRAAAIERAQAARAVAVVPLQSFAADGPASAEPPSPEPPSAEPPSPPDGPSLPHVRAEPECAPALTLSPEREMQEPRTAPDHGPLPREAPLPAARALVPRRQGFVDILAFMLRDSGRRLSRWSSAKRRADDMKAKLAKAEARMRAMEAQLAALQALQARVRQS
jgi:hypothetical protein